MKGLHIPASTPPDELLEAAPLELERVVPLLELAALEAVVTTAPLEVLEVDVELVELELPAVEVPEEVDEEATDPVEAVAADETPT